MMKLELKGYVTFMTLCFVASSAIPDVDDTELNEKVKTILENLLKEREINANGKSSDGNLQSKVELLEKKLELMEARLVEQDKNITDLKIVIKKMERENDSDVIFKGSDKNPHNVSENDGGENMEFNKLIAPGRRIKRSVGNVAFTAYLTQTNSHTIIGHPIKFDQVLLNDGLGYNKYTGAFTAPLSGVYLFTFAIDTRKLTFVRLVINGKNQVDAVANAHTNVESRHAQSMGGNTAIIHVGHGESVLVETFEIPDAETASSDSFRFCTFSGVLLY